MKAKIDNLCRFVELNAFCMEGTKEIDLQSLQPIWPQNIQKRNALKKKKKTTILQKVNSN